MVLSRQCDYYAISIDVMKKYFGRVDFHWLALQVPKMLVLGKKK